MMAMPAAAALLVAASFVFWQTVAAAPVLTFGGPGQVHFAQDMVVAGSEPLLCFDAIEWKRLCPGQTFIRLTPANVLDHHAKTVDLEPHAISTPLAIGAIAPKCRGTKVPAGLAPGIWRLTGHASNTCTLPVIGGVTVTSSIPDSLVLIKTP